MPYHAIFKFKTHRVQVNYMYVLAIPSLLAVLPLIRTMLMLLLYSSLYHQSSISSVDPITFAYANFNPRNCDEGGEFICLGSAVAGDGYVDVTPNPQPINGTTPPSLTNTVGRFLYRYPVLAWPATFSTSFIVRITKDPNLTRSGDGMAFVMAQDSGPSPDNSYGAFLGLLNRTIDDTGGTVHQLGVELDTYYNNEFDPDDNHIGIDTKTIKSDATASLNSIGVDLNGGRPVKIKIDYDGWGKKLQIFAAYVGDPLVSVLNDSIKMSKTVPSSVYVGFTAATGFVSESHQVLSWALTSVPLPMHSLNDGSSRMDKTKRILMIVFPVVAGTLILAIGIYLAIKVCRRRSARNFRGVDIESKSRTAANVPKTYNLKDLSKATSKFSKENLLGTGGFGSVYRGNISEPPSIIAVKKIAATSKQGEREFLAEMGTIGRLRHKNIVKLLGWCHERDNLLLVYEFMPNGSLDRFIGKDTLDWPTRYKILTGLASALLYLHEECGSTVVHRDVKPNNVMVDSDFNACLGDFGLARFFQNEAGATTMLAGTPGYLAPECTYTGKATPESDVFSYGIVVLEVICGKRSGGGFLQNNLVDYVWGLHGKGQLDECMDQRLEGDFVQEQVKRALTIGLACSHPDPTFRPMMRKVVQVFLNPNEPLMDLPDSRPSAIYVTVHTSASSTSGLGSSMASGSCSSSTVPEEGVVQHGR